MGDNKGELTELTEQQVWDIVEYIDGLYRDIKSNGIVSLENYIYNSETEN